MDVKELSDRMEIRQLVYDYARIPDYRDYDLVEKVFTEDGELIAPYFPKPTLKGHAEIGENMRLVETYEATMHQVLNHTVTIDGDHAQGELDCIAIHIFTKDGKKVKGDLGLRYFDRYRRTPDGWRIARRELSQIWQHLHDLDESFI